MGRYQGLAFRAAVAVAVATSITSGAMAAKPVMRWLAYKDPGQLKGFQPILAEFERDTGVRVSITTTTWEELHAKTLVSIAGGVMNEFYAWGTELYAGLARAKAILPLDSQIRASKFDMTKQMKSGLATWQFKGQLWGIPYAFYPSVLYYNRNLFDAAGLVYPTADWSDTRWSWDRFLEDASKLTKRDSTGRVTQSAISSLEWYYMWPVYYGGGFTDSAYGESRLTDPRTVKGLQQMVDLKLRHKVMGDQSFLSGKSAMDINLVSAARWWTGAKFKWDMAATPVGTQHAVPAFVDAFSMGYSKNSKYMWRFIQWMYGDKDRVRRWVEADSGGGAIPTDRDLFGKYLERGRQLYPGVNMQVGIDALDYATPMYLRFNKNWPQANQLIDPVMARIQSGKVGVQDGLTSINAAVDRLMKSGK